MAVNWGAGELANGNMGEGLRGERKIGEAKKKLDLGFLKVSGAWWLIPGRQKQANL